MARAAGSHTMAARRRRQLIALAIVSAVAGALLLARMMNRDSARGSIGVSPAAATAHHQSPNSEAAAAEWIIRPIAVTWAMELRRDLFAGETVPPHPSSQPAATADLLQQEATAVIDLQAIIFGEAPQAMINGEVWRRGQMIGGFRLQQIEQRQIVLEKDGIEIEIGL